MSSHYAINPVALAVTLACVGIAPVLADDKHEDRDDRDLEYAFSQR